MSERDFFEKFGTAGPGPPAGFPITTTTSRCRTARRHRDQTTIRRTTPRQRLAIEGAGLVSTRRRISRTSPESTGAAETGEPGDPDELQSSTSARRGRRRSGPPRIPRGSPTCSGRRRCTVVPVAGTSRGSAASAACEPAGRIGAPGGRLLGEQVRFSDLVSAKKIASRAGANGFTSCRSGRSIQASLPTSSSCGGPQISHR
jgi:hypothetical protein